MIATANYTICIIKDGSKGDKGDTGSKGVGVSSVKQQYYLSSYNNKLYGGSWSDTIPSWTKGKYIWTRMCTTYTDNSTKYSNTIFNTALNKALEDSVNAITIANGKSTVYYNDTEPTGSFKVNDVWFDTKDGANVMHYWDGSKWAEMKYSANSLGEKCITAQHLDGAIITGDNIIANSITSKSLFIDKLSSISANVGTLTAGVLKSTDYQAANAIYDESGNLTNGSIKTGVIFDLNNKYIGTPQTIIGKDYITLLGYMTIGSRVGDIGKLSFVRGYNCKASGAYSQATGYKTEALGKHTDTSGYLTTAFAEYSHAEGNSNRLASSALTLSSDITPTTILTEWNKNGFSLSAGRCSHVEGQNNVTYGGCSHAEGDYNYVEGGSSHVEGNKNKVYSGVSHCEGYGNVMENGSNYSHCAGYSNTMKAGCATTIGSYNVNDGNFSVVIGTHLTNTCQSATILGQYNIDKENMALVVGGGNKDEKINVLELTTYGVLSLANNVYLPNNKTLYARDTNGDGRTLCCLNDNNNYLFGVGGIANNITLGSSFTSNTNIYGTIKAKGDIYIGDGLKKERSLLFYNTLTADSGNTHRVKIYGANESSTTCLGVYDVRKSLPVVVYANSTKSGTGSDTLTVNSKVVFKATGTVTGSDKRLKDNFESLNKYEGFFDSLQPISYTYKDGNSGRKWLGFVAQDVEDALIKNNLTTKDFSGLVIQHCDKNDEDYKYDELYSLRYEEFISLNTHMIQKTRTELKQANKTIEKLNSKIKKLENKINKLL